MFVLLTNWIERMFVTQTRGQRRILCAPLIHFAFGHANSALKQNADKGKHFTGALTVIPGSDDEIFSSVTMVTVSD